MQDQSSTLTDNSTGIDLDTWKKWQEQLTTAQPANTYIPFNPPHPCPHCGYCPYCGRGGYWTYPYYITWGGLPQTTRYTNGTWS